MPRMACPGHPPVLFIPSQGALEMRKLPTSIQISGQDIAIKHCPSLLKDSDLWGDWNPETNTIRVQTPDEKHPKDLCFQAFWHECLHAILDITGHDELSDKEDFVERISQAIYQSEKTRRYQG
jgi:hypothetical protein